MVGHIAAPHHLTFLEKDLPASNNLHNNALHIKVRIHKHIIKRVLIDGGFSLNLCTLKVLKHLGYSDVVVDNSECITIKGYDDTERLSEGTIKFPIQVGQKILEMKSQVLYLDLPYNILLGQPWIHAIQAVPSIFHQCLKFPHNGIEVTINAYPRPFQYCSFLEGQDHTFFPYNKAITKTTSQTDPKTSTSYIDISSTFITRGQDQDK